MGGALWEILASQATYILNILQENMFKNQIFTPSIHFRILFKFFHLIMLLGVCGSFCATNTSMAADDKEEAKKAYVRGRDYFEEGLLDRAIAEYSKGIKLYPDNNSLFTMRAAAYVEKGEFALARIDLKNGEWYRSDHVYLNTVTRLESDGDCKRAITDLIYGIDSWHKNKGLEPNAEINGIVYKKDMEFPYYAASFATLGECYLRQGDKARAVAYAKIAATLKPKPPLLSEWRSILKVAEATGLDEIEEEAKIKIKALEKNISK
jgi:tetratricopeptide (TPR) repeat protein